MVWNNSVDYQTAQTDLNLASKMGVFVTMLNDFQPLIIVAKSSILDVVGILDPTFITDIFASQSWILINLKPISHSYRDHSISSNDKEDDWELYDMNISISNILTK